MLYVRFAADGPHTFSVLRGGEGIARIKVKAASGTSAVTAKGALSLDELESIAVFVRELQRPNPAA